MLAKYVTDFLIWFVDAPVVQGDIDRSGHDIQMVMTYIANHLDGPLDLHQLAAMTGLGSAASLGYSKGQPVIRLMPMLWTRASIRLEACSAIPPSLSSR